MTAVSATLGRFVAMIALFAAFIVMASIFRPRDIRASEPSSGREAIKAMDIESDQQSPPQRWMHLGSLTGRLYTIDAYGDGVDVRFTIFDAATGSTLAEMLTRDEIVSRFGQDADLLDLISAFGERAGLLSLEPDAMH
ncbi:MAG: hypothetical protein ACR2GY_11225 [Phycisphaerales bacterium]